MLRMMADDALRFASAAEWESWLEANHESSDGLWIAIARKGLPLDSVRYPEVLDTAIAFGWIDGSAKPLTTSASCSASPRAARAARGRRSTARSPTAAGTPPTTARARWPSPTTC